MQQPVTPAAAGTFLTTSMASYADMLAAGVLIPLAANGIDHTYYQRLGAA
jgi:hypothetical protein